MRLRRGQRGGSLTESGGDREEKGFSEEGAPCDGHQPLGARRGCCLQPCCIAFASLSGLTWTFDEPRKLADAALVSKR